MFFLFFRAFWTQYWRSIVLALLWNRLQQEESLQGVLSIANQISYTLRWFQLTNLKRIYILMPFYYVTILSFPVVCNVCFLNLRLTFSMSALPHCHIMSSKGKPCNGVRNMKTSLYLSICTILRKHAYILRVLSHACSAFVTHFNHLIFIWVRDLLSWFLFSFCIIVYQLEMIWMCGLNSRLSKVSTFAEEKFQLSSLVCTCTTVKKV